MSSSMPKQLQTSEVMIENATPHRVAQALPDYGKPWWRVPHLLKLNLLLLIPLASSYVAGFDGSMLNGMQSVPAWQTEFNHPSGSALGLVATIQIIGSCVALPFAPWLTDRFGRRHPISLGSIIIVLGAAIQGGATGIGMFIGGRAVVGFGGILSLLASAPLIAELAYPAHRPILTAIFNTSWYLGSIVAAWATYGTFNIPNSWSWRIPCLLQAVVALIQIFLIYLVPESPRWLIANNKAEEAEKILSRHHAGSEEPNDLVRLEMVEIQAAIQTEKLQNTASYLDFFKTKANRHRFCIAVALGFIIQWSGNGLITVYLVQVLNSIGITDPATQNIINGVLQIFNYITAVGSAFTVDRFGRRFLFLFSTAGMSVAFIVWTALSAVNEQTAFSNSGLGIGIVVMIFIFFFFYNTAMSPLPISYLLEVLPFTLRTKGLTIFNIAQFSSIVFNGFTNPIALAAIGWKYYIVFVCLTIVWFILIWFTFPETRGLSLEEVTDVFDKNDNFEATIETKVQNTHG